MISEKLGVPESVADFIEGRVPKRVGARHYMKLLSGAVVSVIASDVGFTKPASAANSAVSHKTNYSLMKVKDLRCCTRQLYLC
jgi:hypothetical protein